MKQHVYIISSSAGLIKVGIAADVEFRRSTLESACGVRLTVAMVFGPFEWARQVECRAHTRLDAYRERGEWFDCSAERAIAAVQDSLIGFIDAAPEDEDAISRSLETRARVMTSTFGNPLLKAKEDIDLLWVEVERRARENAELTNRFLEAAEMLSGYAAQLKESQNMAMSAAMRVRELEAVIACANKSGSAVGPVAAWSYDIAQPALALQ